MDKTTGSDKIMKHMKHSYFLTLFLVLFCPAQRFGKTHFIVGMEQDQYPKNTPSQMPCKPPQALFSCKDDVQNTLIEAIQKEQKHIMIAIFNFTSKEIAQSLLAAKKRGVSVEIITDESSIKEKYSKIPFLFTQGIPIYVFQANAGKMHHKFAVFSDKIWTGSYNFTKSAQQSNQENVLILYEPEIRKQYEIQFQNLRNKSGRLKQLPMIEWSQHEIES